MNRLVRSGQMRALIGALMLALVVAGSAPALACDDDEIEFVAIDGSLIRMRSGATFTSSPRISSMPRWGLPWTMS